MRAIKLFRKNRTAGNPKQEELAGRIAGHITKRQQRIADYLNGRTRHISGKGLLFALIGFCVIFGGYCLYLLIRSINH